MAIKRYFAQILDVIIYGFLSYTPLVIISIIVGLISIINKDLGDYLLFPSIILSTILLPVAFGFFTYLHLKDKSATLGYRLLKLKIVNEDNSSPTNKQNSTRAIIKSLYLVSLIFALVDIIHGFVLFESKGQTDPLDKILKTKCVQIN